jgi:hypothetical protein
MDVNYTGVIGAEILPLPDDYSAIQQAGAFFRSLVPIKVNEEKTKSIE